MRKIMVVLIVALAALLLAFTIGTSLLTNSARQAVDDMLDALEMGEMPGQVDDSFSMLAEDLLEFGMPQYRVEHVRAIPFGETTAVVNLRQGNEQARIFLNLIREQGEWQVETAAESNLTVALDQYPVLVLNLGPQSLSKGLDIMGTDKLLTIQEDQMEWQNRGWQQRSPYFTSFVDYQEDNLIVGMEEVELYGYKGGLAAAVVQDYSPESIRVNLTTTGHESVYHDQIQLRSQHPWEVVETVTGNTVQLSPGTVTLRPDNQGITLVSDQEELSFSHRLIFNTEQHSRTVVASITRSGVQPAYYGSLEVANFDDNLTIVNELAMEDYLRFVVPSEMPASFGSDALKVQAIAARTYAYRNMLSSSWRSTSAHVVDSVLSQVYNNAPENDNATAAIQATHGEIIAFNDAPADIRYFSTSSGYTGSAHQVWSDQGEFPGTAIPWLMSVPQFPEGAEQIEGEEEYAEFIHNPPADAYDGKSPWFRWRAHFSPSQLVSTIEEGLAEVHRSTPEAVQRESGGQFESVDALPEQPVGEIMDLVPAQRGDGGILMAVDIVGSEGTWRVSREYNIRRVLRPLGLVLNDGSSRSNLTLMPSAYMVWDLRYSDDNLTEVVFYGGGNGHGVGMSQYGVRELMNLGWTPEQVIQHYFSGTEVVELY